MDSALGSPVDPANPTGFARALELDEREAFPTEACDRFAALGLHHYCVPQALGGKLHGLDALAVQWRIAARRDLTAVIAFTKSFLGAVPVWVGGSAAQQHKLAGALLRGDSVSLALTERRHGADLLACETTATRTPTGYALDGEKWLINNARRAPWTTVFARTESTGGPRGFSFVLVHQASAPTGTVTHLPKIRTHGARGLDVSGLRFTDLPVDEDCLIGERGTGLELVLTAMQVPKALVPNVALGCVDTALRIVAAFTRERILYRRRVAEIPHVQEILAGALADLYWTELAALGTIRSFQTVPQQMGMRAAIVKALIPPHLEHTVRELALVLGARHYLRDDGPTSMFQKIHRDLGLMSLFDGSVPVNLSHISSTLRHIRLDALPDRELEPVVAPFRLHAELPELEWTALRPFGGGGDALVRVAPYLERRSIEVSSDLPEGVVTTLRAFLQTLPSRVSAIVQAASELGDGDPSRRPSKLYRLSGAYGRVHLATAMLLGWLETRPEMDGFGARGEWIPLALSRLGMLEPDAVAPSIHQTLTTRVLQLEAQSRLFSLFPHPVLPSPTSSD